MLVSIRATNGAGKSTIVRKLIESHRVREHYGLLGPVKTEAIELRIPKVKKPVYVLGPYRTATGGVDNVQPYDLILDLLAKYSAKGHVLFEGVLASSSYGRVGRYMEQFGQEAVMAFMDTSLEQCIANVQTRRKGKGDTRTLDPTNLTAKFHSVAKSKEKIAQEGKVRVVELSMSNGPEKVLELLRSAK